MRAKKLQNQMNKTFSRISLVGKVEDPRVADSMVTLARHLRSRGLAVLVDRGAAITGLPDGIERPPVDGASVSGTTS